MDDIEPDEDLMEARRRWLRRMDELNRELQEQPEPELKPARLPVQIPAVPNFGRQAAKHGQDAEDCYSNRMAQKYGGEW